MRNVKERLTIILFFIMALAGMFNIFLTIIEICNKLLKLIP